LIKAVLKTLMAFSSGLVTPCNNEEKEIRCPNKAKEISTIEWLEIQ
jgi:hypothetical protein